LPHHNVDILLFCKCFLSAVQPGNWSLSQTSPLGAVFIRWDCYSSSNGSWSVTPLPNINDSIILPINSSIACVALYNVSGLPPAPQLALLALLPEAFNGSMPKLQAIQSNTSNSTCEKNPSTRWAPPNVMITSPGRGWCGAGATPNGTIPAGNYTLVATTPGGTAFARWDCYNIITGNATALNVTANNTIVLELGASVTCVATYTLEQAVPQLALLSQLPAAYNGTATPALTASPDGVGPSCIRSPSARIDANITITAPGSAGLCGAPGDLQARSYSLGQAATPPNTTFDRWQCYSVSGSSFTLLNLTAPNTVELNAGGLTTCVALYTMTVLPTQSQLSLLSQVNAPAGFPYAGSGAQLSAVGPGNSNCSKAPSELVSSTVNATAPGPAGQCTAANSMAAGRYNLSQVAPFGTVFVHWECYNVTGGTAGAALVADSVSIVANDIWTCIARECLKTSLLCNLELQCVSKLQEHVLALVATRLFCSF
jgi:hypothetical protein